MAKVLIADRARGEGIEEINDLARRSGIRVERVKESRITAVARNGKQHQGVVADVIAPNMSSLSSFLEHRNGRRFATTVVVLDGVHNPANVGMILRSAVAAGIDGVVVPSAGTADIGPLVIKASAGVAFAAPIVRTDTADGAVSDLVEARFTILGLDAGGDESLFEAELPERCALLLGNESEGPSEASSNQVHRWLSIPVAEPVESLNVACAATLAMYELQRR